jgi:hypothetical protein
MNPTIENLSNGKDETFVNELDEFFGVLAKLLEALGVDRPLGNALVRDSGYRASEFVEPATNLADAASNGRAPSKPIDPRDSMNRSTPPNDRLASQRSIAISSLTNLATTLLHNVTRAGSSGARFQRVMWTNQLPEQSKAAFHELVVGRGAALLEILDDRLSAAEAEAGSRDSKSDTQAGVGIYYFEGKAGAAPPGQ